MRAKATFQSASATDLLHVVELDQRDDGPDIQRAAMELTHQRTVPNVFISGKHIGGSDTVVALAKSGELAKLLDKARKGGL